MKLRHKLEPRFRKSFPSKKGRIIYEGKHTYIKDYRKYLQRGSKTKRALVSFVTQPIVEDLQGYKSVQFSNNGMARSMLKVFNRLGYLVDVVDWDNKSFSTSQKYDLILIHGGKNLSRLVSCAKPGTKFVYFATGSYWKWHNLQEKKRFDDFFRRHKVKLRYDRYVSTPEDKAHELADGLICLGNDRLKRTYKGFANVYNLNNASFPISKRKIKKRHNKTRNSFMFLAGPGNIHKGLDLLLDTFKESPQYSLHIVGTLDKDFEKFYRKELYHLPNVHTYGFLSPRSSELEAVAKQCSFIIFPSCSEGSPGSVIEAMHYGLIPIVSKESHIDVKPFGFVLKDCKIPTLKKIILKTSRLNTDDLKTRALNSYKAGGEQFSISNFEHHLERDIRNIIDSKS